MPSLRLATMKNVKIIYISHISQFAGWGLELQENGEYTGIVVQVEEEAPELSCRTLLHNLKVTASKHVTWQY